MKFLNILLLAAHCVSCYDTALYVHKLQNLWNYSGFIAFLLRSHLAHRQLILCHKCADYVTGSMTLVSTSTDRFPVIAMTLLSG